MNGEEQYELVERQWDGWHFQSIQETVGDTMFSFYRVKDENGTREGLEIYSGENYVVGSKSKSYSRHYSITNRHSIMELPSTQREKAVEMRSTLRRILGDKLLKI